MIEFSEILDEISDYLKDNILAEDILNIEEDVIGENPVYYIVLDSVDEKGVVSSERICTIYPSVINPPTYDASSVAEIFSSTFLFLNILSNKFKLIDKESVELKALKQLLKLTLGNLLKMETKLLKLVTPEDAKKEDINLNDFVSYWKFIEGIIGPLEEEMQFSFTKKATSENKVVIPDVVDSKVTSQEKIENEFVVNVVETNKVAVIENQVIDSIKESKEEVLEQQELSSDALAIKTTNKEEITDNEKEPLQLNLDLLSETKPSEKILTTSETEGYKTPITEVQSDKNLSLVVGADFSKGNDRTIYTELRANNTHFSQEMLAVSK